MIELITGLPGNAKTLYTIGEVKRRAEAEGRPVYYAGIKELQLDWVPIEADKWMECPAGSIIVIDECQKVFRNRSLGAQPPAHVTELEEHRHRGLDFYMITQHPSLVDPALRRLVQTHKHLIRIFGMEASTVHKWSVCTDNPDKSHMRKDSEKTRWAFDKSLYGLYKSAEVHTMKRSIPKGVWLVLALPVVVAAAGGFVWWQTIGKQKQDMVAQAAEVPGHHGSQASAGVVASAPAMAAGPKFDPMADAKRYVWENTPRVEGLQHTAPKYDELTKPVRVPVPAACIQYRGTCKCLSQQGTPMDVKESMCVEFARNGFFQEFDPEKDREASERTARSVRVLNGQVDEQVGAAGGQVAVFTNPPRDPPHVPAVGGAQKGG